MVFNKAERYIDFHFCDLEEPVFFNENRIRKWIEQVIKEEGREAGLLSFVISNDEFLVKLNREYLQHDFFTDVITFDYSEDLNGVSGDVYISLERVEENASELGIRVSDEMKRVMVHGVLHLLGYDDTDEAMKQTMREKENYYLSLI